VILFDLAGGKEDHPVYQSLAVANASRQYDFLRSIVAASIQLQRQILSEHILKALNFQAITCLHTSAGEYRPCIVTIRGTEHQPPEPYQVPALMEDFVNSVNRSWEKADPVALAAYVLWGLNYIHPFINGNGRTARAACYFVLCLSAGAWLPGTTTLPELLVRDHADYVAALRAVDESLATSGGPDLKPLHALLAKLLQEQLASVPPPTPAAPVPAHIATPPASDAPPDHPTPPVAAPVSAADAAPAAATPEVEKPADDPQAAPPAPDRPEPANP
jgi:hypothetical protein